jgi:hypothetical protein
MDVHTSPTPATHSAPILNTVGMYTNTLQPIHTRSSVSFLLFSTLLIIIEGISHILTITPALCTVLSCPVLFRSMLHRALLMGITQLFVLSTRTMQWFEERGERNLTEIESMTEMRMRERPLCFPCFTYPNVDYLIFVLDCSVIATHTLSPHTTPTVNCCDHNTTLNHPTHSQPHSTPPTND